MQIRRAEKNDIPRVEEILYQVHDVHATARPDLFIKGKKKYSVGDLEEIFADETKPVFVCCDDNGLILGYAFCIDKSFDGNDSMNPDRMLYIDDVCVDKESRGMYVGTVILDYVKRYARDNGYDRITLNVWDFNESARAFYDKNGFTPLKTTMEVRF
jgi:ribosomal protein S18 acetylase RimI-like enzyme